MPDVRAVKIAVVSFVAAPSAAANAGENFAARSVLSFLYELVSLWGWP